MAGLDQAIHASPQANFTKESVDDRVKPGYDEWEWDNFGQARA